MKKKMLVGVLIAVVVWGCDHTENTIGSSEYDRSASVGKEEIGVPSADSTLSVAMVGNDSTRMFIKNIEMKFRVKNVFNASLRVEELCRKYKGFIILSQLGSNMLYTETKKIHEDSSLEILHYVVNTTIKLRVPVEKTDSFINAVYPLIDYLDSKTISAEEVGFQYLHNKKRIERREKFKANVRKSQKTSNVSGENIVLHREDEEDDAVVENLKLLDDVKFSNITLEMYQREQIKTTLIPNDKSFDEYQPNFFKQLWNSLVSGWYLLKDIILFLVSGWPVWLLISFIVFVVVKYRRRKAGKK